MCYNDVLTLDKISQSKQLNFEIEKWLKKGNTIKVLKPKNTEIEDKSGIRVNDFVVSRRGAKQGFYIVKEKNKMKLTIVRIRDGLLVEKGETKTTVNLYRLATDEEIQKNMGSMPKPILNGV